MCDVRQGGEVWAVVLWKVAVWRESGHELRVPKLSHYIGALKDRVHDKEVRR